MSIISLNKKFIILAFSELHTLGSNYNYVLIPLWNYATCGVPLGERHQNGRHDIQFNDIQQNGIQYNNTQHKNITMRHSAST